MKGNEKRKKRAKKNKKKKQVQSDLNLGQIKAWKVNILIQI